MEKHEHWTGRAACVQEYQTSCPTQDGSRKTKTILKKRTHITSIQDGGFAEWKNKTT